MSADTRTPAQVVALPGGRCGVVWGGLLQACDYPSPGRAWLAVAALRRGEAQPQVARAEDTPRSLLLAP